MVGSLFCGAVLGALSSFAIILLKKSACCLTLIVLWLSVFCLFHKLCVGLQPVIVAFSGYAHFLNNILCIISFAIPYVPHPFVLIFVQYRTF